MFGVLVYLHANIGQVRRSRSWVRVDGQVMKTFTKVVCANLSDGFLVTYFSLFFYCSCCIICMLSISFLAPVKYFYRIVSYHINIRSHCSNGYMRHIATDGVAWSVCLSVCVGLLVTFISQAKMAESIGMPFGGTDSRGSKEPLLDENPDPLGKGHF